MTSEIAPTTVDSWLIANSEPVKTETGADGSVTVLRKISDSLHQYAFAVWAEDNNENDMADYLERTVTYEWDGDIPDGVTLPEQVTAEYGKSFTPATVTAPERYAFDGWYKGDTKISDSLEIEGNVTLTGKWSKNKVRVTYHWIGEAPDGAELPEADVVNEGEKLTELPTPTAVEGYEFVG